MRPGLRAIRVAPALLYVVAIFVLGSLPAPPQAPAGMSDKLQHLIGFALLVPLTALALTELEGRLSPRRRLLASVAVTSLLGALLEAWQALLPHRSCELLDWVADTAGAALMALFWLAWHLARGSLASTRSET